MSVRRFISTANRGNIVKYGRNGKGIPMEQKTVAVNFVAKHSYVFVQKMVEGLAHNGCRILAVVSQNMPEIQEWEKIEGITLYPVNGYTSIANFPVRLLVFFVKDAGRIKRIAREMGVQSVYLPICTYWSVFINLLFRGKKTVYAMHDPIPHDRRQIVIWAMNRWLGIRADTILILSDTFRDYVKQHCHKNDDEIITVPEGAVRDSESMERTCPLVQYDDSKVNFLFQGRIDRYKGLTVLAEAYRRIREKYDNVTLTVAGSGNFSEYESLYRDLKDCTVINRWLSSGEVAGLFNDRSVIAVLPYLSATQSGVINVAMPSGSPIIATRCGGIVEQVVDNETGYLIPPNDADALFLKMEYVINSRDDWGRIRENAYRRMQGLAWDALSMRLAQVL